VAVSILNEIAGALFYIVYVINNSVPDNGRIKILFVLNPRSGNSSKAELEIAIHNYFQGIGHHYEWYQTTGDRDEVSIRHWVQSWQPDRVVAVGGDGTLKLVAEVLLGTNIPVGVIPAGSANGMARELGLPTATDACMDIIMQGECRPIDVLRINNKDICLHLSDLGLNAQLVKHFEENDWKGKLGYARGALKVLLRKHRMQVVIKSGDQVIEREAFMVVLANARMYGTGAVINPDGNLSDGVFEIIIIRELSFIEVVKMFLGGKNLNPAKTEILPAQSIEIQVNGKAYFQVDGEYMGKVTRVAAVVEKQALCVMQARII
jgi:YegS/Rv2252/BmrU family lipid kinase